MTEPDSPRSPKKLEVVPGEYDDVAYVVTGNRVVAAVARALAPIVRAGLSIWRRVTRMDNTLRRPPRVR